MSAKDRHLGRTTAEQARFMYERMKLSAASKQAKRFAKDASDPGVGAFWLKTADILDDLIADRLSPLELVARIEAERLAEMTQKAAKKQPMGVSIAGMPSTQAAQGATKSGMPVEEWLRRVVVTLAAKLDSARGMIDKFKADFEVNPAYALEYAHSTFEAAARGSVFGWAFKALTDEHGAPQLYRPAESPALTGKPQRSTLERVRERAHDELVKRAASPHRSTSQTSNLLEQEVLAAWADLLELLA